MADGGKQVEVAETPVSLEDLPLLILQTFHDQGREEISLSEFLESASLIEGWIGIDFEFADKFLYSSKLVHQLDDLHRGGYIRQYKYRYDAFIPKHYLNLTPLGRHAADEVIAPAELRTRLESATLEAISNHERRWRLLGRHQRSTYKPG